MTPDTNKPLIPPTVKDNRKIEKIPFPAFLATVGVIVPIFSLTVLPLSIAYQLGKSAFDYVGGGSLKETGWSYNDSAYDVQPEQRKTSKERKYDVIVLGATGFTGGLAVRHLVQTYGVIDGNVKWAIAGRSQKKLNDFKEQLSKELKDENVKKIPTVIVDTSKPSTMPALVEDTRVVATTAGPYSLYGSAVVEFCAKFGTHYVDITGEDTWVKQMAIRYQAIAKQTGAKIIPFCGHDSIPWDTMVMKLQDTLEEKFSDNLKSVQFWDEMKGDFAGGTLATMIAGVEGKLATAPKTKPSFFKRNASGTESLYHTIKNFPLRPQRVISPWDGNGKESLSSTSSSRRWATPFFMADINANVVSWSRALRQKGSTTLTYSEQWVHPDFQTAITIYSVTTMLFIALLNPLTLAFMKRNMTQPGGGGPSIEDMEKKHYLQVAAEGVGEKGNRVEAMMYFPKDTGCMETSRMLIESALCLALEKESLPNHDEGGFWSPSTGLGNTVLKRILDTGSTLDIRVIPSLTTSK